MGISSLRQYHEGPELRAALDAIRTKAARLRDEALARYQRELDSIDSDARAAEVEARNPKSVVAVIEPEPVAAAEPEPAPVIPEPQPKKRR